VINFEYDDGGAREAGFRGEAARDCVARAFAIATGNTYLEVRSQILRLAKLERTGKRSTPRGGVANTTVKKLAHFYGMSWTPTMSIGSGTTVHVRADELPAEGRHVLNLSKHVSAYIDGVVHDTHDPSRDGKRAVYGYWTVREH
jgi:hypothetical protein